jgi:hypothetical protein
MVWVWIRAKVRGELWYGYGLVQRLGLGSGLIWIQPEVSGMLRAWYGLGYQTTFTLGMC